MDVQILGPLSISEHNRDATPSARKPKQLLSLLLLNEGRVVSTDSLITEIWDTRPPRSVQTTLQTYVVQVRRLLSEALQIPVGKVARDVLLTRNGGYTLILRDANFDLYRFRSLEQAGMGAFEEGDEESAVRIFDQALALWRGNALADVEVGRLLEPEVARLEQSRLTVVECRLETELRRGRHRQSLSELASLTARYDDNENLHALYMLALYRAGHRGKALERYRSFHKWMRDELGLEPSPRLQRLHHAVLDGDPALDEALAQDDLIAGLSGRGR
ncbi:AfsR/SARP family transcriptional regulator [Streptomyces daliensis]|uniref:AfsR/SARP family transcriptional regulator n=1 Tax=Streptomyces daliensis TaxID=299421 RepID=A0A8T4IM81_9ACTN|nr:AfsR/SARP family transcriptional regulator [Streptomyces daliensis]